MIYKVFIPFTEQYMEATDENQAKEWKKQVWDSTNSIAWIITINEQLLNN